HPPAPSPTEGGGGGEAMTNGRAHSVLRCLSPPPPSVGEGAGGGEGEAAMDRWEVPIHLRREMVEVARVFRKQPTRGEAILWDALRGRRCENVKFRRQQPLWPFVMDFFAAERRLIVEVDGPIHDSQQEADRRRQELLESIGMSFVRIKTETV